MPRWLAYLSRFWTAAGRTAGEVGQPLSSQQL